MWQVGTYKAALYRLPAKQAAAVRRRGLVNSNQVAGVHRIVWRQ